MKKAGTAQAGHGELPPQTPRTPAPEADVQRIRLSWLSHPPSRVGHGAPPRREPVTRRKPLRELPPAEPYQVLARNLLKAIEDGVAPSDRALRQVLGSGEDRRRNVEYLYLRHEREKLLARNPELRRQFDENEFRNGQAVRNLPSQAPIDPCDLDPETRKRRYEQRVAWLHKVMDRGTVPTFEEINGLYQYGGQAAEGEVQRLFYKRGLLLEGQAEQRAREEREEQACLICAETDDAEIEAQTHDEGLFRILKTGETSVVIEAQGDQDLFDVACAACFRDAGLRPFAGRGAC